MLGKAHDRCASDAFAAARRAMISLISLGSVVVPFVLVMVKEKGLRSCYDGRLVFCALFFCLEYEIGDGARLLNGVYCKQACGTASWLHHGWITTEDVTGTACWKDSRVILV